LSDNAPTAAIVEAVATAVNNGGQGIVSAVADAFAQAENSNANALSEVFAEGLGDGGDNAAAVS